MTRRPLAVAIVLVCALAASPALARHHHHRQVHRQHVAAVHHYHHRHAARPKHRLRTTPVAAVSFGGGLVSGARRYIGDRASQLGLPGSLWCADFMNKVLRDHGKPTTGSRQAKSFLRYGYRVPGPQVGAIAVLSRGRGGHVGIVSAIDANGNPVIISGNHGHAVGEGVYPRRRVLAYVMPPS